MLGRLITMKFLAPAFQSATIPDSISTTVISALMPCAKSLAPIQTTKRLLAEARPPVEPK